jgi:hypothetical protein
MEVDRRANPIAQAIPPMPVPMAVSFDTLNAPDSGDPLVEMRIETPLGVLFFYLTPNSAIDVGNKSKKAGQDATAKLTKPQKKLLVPGQ